MLYIYTYLCIYMIYERKRIERYTDRQRNRGIERALLPLSKNLTDRNRTVNW